jgi:phosphatidylglycerol:prolipoprotein diacylglycerol transferase
MIPYFQILQFDLGIITIQSWGAMVALGFIVSIFIAIWRARALGLNHQVIWDIGLGAIVGAIIGSRLFHVFFYRWEYFSEHLKEIIYFWTPGYSLYGGMFGLAVGVFIVIKSKKIDFWHYADIIAFSAPAGLAIGRIGCFLIHDHPGIETGFFLGVRYPEAARWDLGLMQLIANLIIFVIFLALIRKQKFVGFYVSFFFLYYAITRFVLDFLRIYEGPMADARYFFLTPAQYFSVALLVIGIIIFIKKKKSDVSIQI